MNQKLSYARIDEMRLFTDKRYIQFIVLKENTIVKNIKVKKNKSEIVDF